MSDAERFGTREVPVPQIGDDMRAGALSFRVSLTLAARSLAGIAAALHRIADSLERREP